MLPFLKMHVSLLLGVGRVLDFERQLFSRLRLSSKSKPAGDGATGDRAAVMVRLQDKLYSVDLFTSQLRLIGGKPGDGSTQVSARQSAVDASGESLTRGSGFQEVGESRTAEEHNCWRFLCRAGVERRPGQPHAAPFGRFFLTGEKLGELRSLPPYLVQR